MRIAMIQDDWWPRTGGGPVHVKELAVALAEGFSYEVDIYTRALRQDGERFESRETYADGAVVVHRLGPCTEYWNPVGRSASLLGPLLPVLRDEYDIVHGHTFLPALSTRLAGAVGDIPTVFTVHGTALTSGVGRDTSALSRVKRVAERQFVLGFDYDEVISVNREHLDLLKGNHESVTYIPNGVDIERFATDTKRVPGRILFLGRLAPKKRVSDLIRAYDQIATEYPESELVIVGVGPEKDSLEAEVRRRGLVDEVSFEGRVPDDMIPTYYGSASVFVLPSVWEGHPLTLLEAWAAELPVIATNVEGIREFVDHEQTGYLVEPEEPTELADALRTVLDDPERAAQWGKSGRDLVAKQYTWAGAAQRVDELYRRIS